MVMLKLLLSQQREVLNHFFDQMNEAQAQIVLQMLVDCQGVVICSGVGKSGHVAEKIAATFTSTGTRAVFLNPSHALHGDIGFVKPEDLILFFSKSGQSKELIDLIPFIRKKGAKIIAIVSQKDSKLSELCDFSLFLPVQKEICPFDLAPTCSSAIQMIFGDCLAIALSQTKNFALNDFALNHPAGLLGRKITMKVADLMLKKQEMPLCSPNDLLIDVLHELSSKKCGCLLAIDSNEDLQGIFTDGDLRRAIHKNGPQALRMTIAEVMTTSPKSIAPELRAIDAVKLMEENRARLITVLPVVSGQKLIGLIRMHDILQKEIS